MLTKTINLNLDLNAPPAILHVTQGDTAWEWHFRLFMDGSRWTIPTGAQIIFKGLKPDGHVFAFSGAVSSNEAVVTSDLQMTICAGEVPCSLIILDANAKRLAFGRITMYVAADAEGQFDVASESALPAYVELLEQYAQLIDEAASIPDDLPGYITENVAAWLDAHPEATTTVEDGAVTKAKLAAALVAELTPDATISVAGKPADAKATGDAVGALKSAFNNQAELMFGISEDVFIQKVNMIDPDSEDIETGGFYTQTGTWTQYNNYCESGYFPALPNQKFFMINSSGGYNLRTHVVFFDANKNYVAGVYNDDALKTVPSNTAIRYGRTALSMSEIKNTQVVFDDTLPQNPETVEYPRYKDVYASIKKAKEIDILRGEIDIINGDGNFEKKLPAEMPSGMNMIDLSPKDEDVEDGGFYDVLGNWIANPNYATVSYIPAKRGWTFFCSLTGNSASNLAINFLDINKQYIIGVSTLNNLATVPNDDNIAFVRCPIYKQNYNTCVFAYANQLPEFPIDPNDYQRYAYTKTILEKIENLENGIETINSRIDDITIQGNDQWRGKTWYAYGTSITETDNPAHTGKYAPYLAELSGMTLVNKGIGGGGITDLGGYSRGQVKTAVMNTSDGKLNADLITLEVGPNDVGSAQLIGDVFDTTSDTFSGCLNQCIQYLQKNTNAQVVIIQSVCSNTYEYGSEDQQNDYRKLKAIEDCCRANRVPMIRANTNMGLEKIRGNNTYVVDNIHHTEVGGYNMAISIWMQLRNIPPFFTSVPND